MSYSYSINDVPCTRCGSRQMLKHSPEDIKVFCEFKICVTCSNCGKDFLLRNFVKIVNEVAGYTEYRVGIK